MTGALNGRGHAVPAHRYQALELSGSEPYPDTTAAYEDFVARVIARLEVARGEAVGPGERTELWTVYRLGRFDEQLALAGVRGVAVRRGMDGDAETLAGARIATGPAVAGGRNA